MSNTIKAKVEFYYKGELFAPSAMIELDQYMTKSAKLPDLYLLLATKNQIDSYSYHYEVMLLENIVFTDGTGLVKEFCHDGEFDIDGFQKAWIVEKELELIQSIARKVLKIDDLQQQPDIKEALLLAYQEGQKSN